MLADFQQAFADLVASPDLCVRARQDPGILTRSYHLTDREQRRLVALAGHDGMEINCMVYRANRLAPLALNLPELCQTLGADLRPMAIEFWNAYPTTEAHFVLEASRFCEFLYQQLAAGRRFEKDIRPVLDREAGLVQVRLRASQGQA